MDQNIVTRDPDILGGVPVFTGTRVPVAVLFENLADGLSLDEILDSYPTLSRELAVAGQSMHLHAIEDGDHYITHRFKPSGSVIG